MDKEEEIIEKRKEKIISWIKQPLNFSLALVLLLGIAIRIYYFWINLYLK